MIDEAVFHRAGDAAAKEWANKAQPALLWIGALPCPAWLKYWSPNEGVFRMRWINPAYEAKYNITADEYRGKTDEEVWGEAVAAMFSAHDDIARRRPVVFEEDAPTPEDSLARGRYCKFPVRIDGRLHVGGLELSDA